MTPLEHAAQRWARTHCEHLWYAWLGHRPRIEFDVWLKREHLDVWIEFAKDYR
jgi:hypothetical protein